MEKANLTFLAGFFDSQPVGTGAATLVISAPLSVNGVGTGSGGSLDLGSNSTTTFNVGLTKANNNGVAGAISVSGGTGSGGSNGSITLSNNDGSVTNIVALTATSDATLTAGGANGSVILGAALGSASTVDVMLTASGGGAVSQVSTKALVSGANIVLIGGSGATGNVGGKTVFLTDASSGLGASGGGTVNISNSSTSAITLGNSGAGSLGSFKLATAGGLTADNISAGTAITVSAKTGSIGLTGNIATLVVSTSTVSLTATAGSITGIAAADFGAGKSVTLSATKGSITTGAIGGAGDLTPLTVSLTALNGVSSLGNINATTTITAKATNTKTGTIDLGGNLETTSPTAGVIALTASGGNIIAGAASDDISAGKSVTLSATKGSITVGTVGAKVTTNIVTLTALNAVGTLGTMDAKTSVTAKATSATAGGILLGGAVDAASPTAGVVVLTASGKNVVGTGFDISGGKSVTVTATKGQDTLGTVGVATPTSAITISALGNVSTNGLSAINTVTEKATAVGSTIQLAAGSIDASSATKGAVSLTASGITANTGTDISGGLSVTLTAAKGSISVANVGTSPTGIVKLTALNSVASSGSLTGTSVTLSQTSKLLTYTLGVNTLPTGISVKTMKSTNGAISAIAAGAAVTVVDGAVISAGAAGAKPSKTTTILLEDSNLTAGTIAIGTSAGTGATISTLAVTGGKANINVVIGAVPSKGVPGVAPAGVTIGTSTGGAVFYGPTGVLASSSSGKINLQGANILFNAPTTRAGSISFFHTTLTADPPAAISVAPLSVGRISPQSAQVTADTNTLSLPQSGLNAVQVVPNSGISGVGGVSGVGNVSGVNGVTGDGGGSTNAAVSSINAAAGIADARISGDVSNVYSQMPARIPNQVWINDTEMISGEVPAIVSSDEDLGVTTDVSVAVELKEMSGEVESKPVNPSQLTGAVSCNGGAGKTMSLKRGAVVFAPTLSTVVETRFGAVHLAAHSLALLIAFHDGVAVYNLDDRHAGSVNIDSGTSHLQLRPGEQAVLTDASVKNLADVNPTQAIGYRARRERNMGNGIKAFTSEFDAIQSLRVVLPLKQIVSSQHPGAKKIASRLLKTTAIMMQIGSANGPYVPVQRAQMTAWQPR